MPDSGRIPLLARYRVGTKLVLLALLPVCGLLAFTAASGVANWRKRDDLRHFQDATRLSFALSAVGDRLGAERYVTTLARLSPDAQAPRRLAAAERATNSALRAASARAARYHGSLDVAGTIDSAGRQLRALRTQVASGSLTAGGRSDAYGVIVTNLQNTVEALDAGRPTRASGRSADAYLAILTATEAARREQMDKSVLLATHGNQLARAGRWSGLERSALDAFRRNTSGSRRAELDALLYNPAGIRVQQIRADLLDHPARVMRQVSLGSWLAASSRRLDALRRVKREAAVDLRSTASHDLGSVETASIRDLALLLAVLGIVTALVLALGRSISRPLGEVSQSARMLATGNLNSDLSYRGRDEIGDVAAAFRDLHVTTDRLAREIRAMNVAVEDNRLDHRADASALGGTWSQLLGGMNDTMAAFGESQGSRLRAERDADRTFEMSLDLLCVVGYDGYFKRVNPAFERLIGYPMATLLSRPTEDFVHPEDRGKRNAAHGSLELGEEVVRFDLRQLCSDGSICRVEWSARPVPEEQLIYAVGRDVTEARRAAGEQAALRRVATLVARGVSRTTIFEAVAHEVGRLFETTSADVLRYEADGTLTVLGAAPDRAPTDEHGTVAARVARTRRATRRNDCVAAPIIVEDRLWGVIAVSAGVEPLPSDAEARLASFTELVATAIANAESRAELTASRARVVAASDDARQRIERNLHDSVQQRLVTVGLKLRDVKAMLPPASPEAAAVDDLAQDLTEGIDELREITRGIHPAALSKGGLEAALRALVRRSAVPVSLRVDPNGDRVPPPLEIAAYYVAAEALTNAVKHARASRVVMELSHEGPSVTLTIRDDGVGGASFQRGSGLIGLADRVEAVGGRLRIASPAGGGTVLQATFRVDNEAAPQRRGAQGPVER
jgi:PAS domain S-box-containing protein